jgi:hypothetical protein
MRNGLFREYMTYSIEPSSVVAAELPGWMRVVFLTKLFNSGSTIRHAHETTSDGEFQQSVDIYMMRERNKRGEIQRNEALKDRRSVPLTLRFAERRGH